MESEKINNRKASYEDNPVKSKAIVKFSAVRPATFSKLQCNTDLNMPPANWLSNSANSYGLQHVLCHSTGFSSFRMAHMFPECVGEVDVVSSAENIKHLLKLPHSPKSGISMMVHRIENTLLIDDFDIHKYLLRKSDDDWKWLRSFIYEHINSLSEKERTGFIKNKSRDVLLKKNLVSKFLYHSISETTEGDKQNCVETITVKKNIPLQLTGPILPEPKITENVPDPNTNHVHNRNVVWTFEDIRMLIGTDMPIFGEMCISLRLRDMSQPINVLTGIDYWLDNLMCNVPEVVMCYHLDGIVQKYEIIKTEDLPNIENSKFSPKVIRNVAQNILSFLKANATKAGHTYWLFKGKNDDVVKLYDLTTLCTNNDNCDEDKKDANKEQNPFTVPVAMLLYTVARNMKNATEKITAKQAGSIKTLLDNCIQLLSKEKHPQIITSSHYLLSDLYIPAGINPVKPDFQVDGATDSPENNDEEEQYSDNLINSSNVAVKLIQETLEEYNLDDNWKHNSSPPPISGDINERCFTALKHITNGLDCLQYFTSNEEQLTKEKDERAKEEEKQKIIHEEQNQKMAKPFQPIPLPYEPLQAEPKEIDSNEVIPLEWASNSTTITLDKNLKKNSCQKKKKKLRIFSENQERESEIRSPRSLLLKGESGVIKSWSTHLKILLFEKACLVYATLAELGYSNENYGRSLKCIYMALRCQEIVTINISSISSQKSCLLGRVGDCFFQMSKNVGCISGYLEEFHAYTHVDRIIFGELKKDTGSVKIEYPTPDYNIEQLMKTSCDYYENALECASKSSKHELVRRLGSVINELGVKYMHWAQEEYSKFIQKQETDVDNIESDNSLPKQEPLFQNLACKSYDCLLKGIKLFEEVNDAINLSFLYCNMGRFMRFRSHIHLPGEISNNISVQKKFYNEAFAFYNKAMGKLESRKQNVELWDLVNWELSTATFTLAKQLQDFSEAQTGSAEEIEMEVVDMLQRSLKLCDINTTGPRQILYLFRTALINHRLASYYHHVYRTIHDESRKRTVLQLCRLHYEKSSKTLENLLEPKEFLEVQLERVSLQEYQADVSSSFTQKLRHLQGGLEFLLRSDKILEHLATFNSLESNQLDDIKKLLFLFEQRLQVILRTLTKICLTKQNGDGKLTALYKKMYSTILLSTAKTDDNFEDLIKGLYYNLIKIKNYEQN